MVSILHRNLILVPNIDRSTDAFCIYYFFPSSNSAHRCVGSGTLGWKGSRDHLIKFFHVHAHDTYCYTTIVSPLRCRWEILKVYENSTQYGVLSAPIPLSLFFLMKIRKFTYQERAEYEETNHFLPLQTV